MKNVTKIALALALIGGVSATALTVDSASARGWGKDCAQKGERFKGPGGMRGMGGPGKLFKQFDANQDKTLTKEEVTTGIAKKISDNDKDGDNAVSLEEFKAEWQKMTQDRMVRAFQRMDKDGSGKVTAAELQQQADRMFDRMDRNDDGKLNKDDRPKRGFKRFGSKGPGFMHDHGSEQGEQAPQS